MAKIQILNASQADLEQMAALDHHTSSSYAYKLEFTRDSLSWNYVIQRIRLPRTVNITYPRTDEALFSSWSQASVVYVGWIADQITAYATFESKTLPRTARVTNLVVASDVRRKGIGTNMLTAGEIWAANNHLERVLIEIPMRNDPAINLACKAGYEMCGYMDQYFPNSDPALFFEKRIG